MWINKNIDLPLFHIDLHGKMSRLDHDKNFIDVGIEVMKTMWWNYDNNL